jgi:hypothetical protein
MSATQHAAHVVASRLILPPSAPAAACLLVPCVPARLINRAAHHPPPPKQQTITDAQVSIKDLEGSLTGSNVPVPAGDVYAPAAVDPRSLQVRGLALREGA